MQASAGHATASPESISLISLPPRPHPSCLPPLLSAGEAKAFWQHSGEILSSRQAQAALRLLGHEPVEVMKPLVDACPQAQALAKTRSALPPIDVKVGTKEIDIVERWVD